ncbi:translation initiation factor IF-2 [Winogradskyella undariae]|uniref:translation initiation factor IF-2 n=1 Tax=Winogradskyella TaxID=286104 RepID=UPI00156A7FE1|nr:MULTISPECIES: translation initiation factor IF-2 [Winogradskyella]NRR90848.1 translation initiation factor IF-2 [Winogradskyella undariae]QXP80175.1 translation initiation factor IF-2 [Winogradskyella sp. HaHa_3_26]
MAQTTRLNKVLRELNISIDRAVDFLESKGVEIEKSPNTKISQEVYNTLSGEFQTDASKREKAQEVSEAKLKEKEELREQREREIEEKQKQKAERDAVVKAKAELSGPKQVGKIDLDNKSKTVKEEAPKTPEVKETPKAETPKVEIPEVKAEVPKVEAKEPEKPKETPKAEEVAKVEKVEPKVEKKEKVEEVKPKPRVTNLDKVAQSARPEPRVVAKKEDKPSTPTEPVEETIKTKYQKLSGPTTTGKKIDLSQFNKPKKKKVETAKPGDANKRKRRRISKTGDTTTTNNKPKFDNRRGGGPKGRGGNAARPKVVKTEPTEEDVQKQIRETLEKLQGKSNKGKGAKYRRDKRDHHRQQTEIDQEIAAAESKTIKVTEFVTVSEMATMMEVGVTQVISACMSLGMMVTMNQRLDAETLTIVAEEFGFDVEFIKADIEESIVVVEDDPKDLIERAPIVTVMGHVDHGKTSLLDYIRKENVIAGESGGITQHIGAYGVQLESGQKIAFLDTPGHEAFTAMRARGAQVTDIAIIVVAADDAIMPQTKEAISHAQAAGVPIVFAINKIDKPDANPEKVKEQLAQMNLLVEDWGGKIQSHDISAKKGTGVKDLLEKVLLEAELLELKANPNKAASGTVVEAYLDKGRGYVSTILVQAGTLKVGDYVLAGKNSGKVKAMQDERGQDVKEAGPATPVSILGLDGAPQAGDKFNVFADEREAKQIATKRAQLQREQSVRTQRHITLDEIGRRIALGDFQELNIILKGDVDGSVEALTDSFQKLSTEEIQVNIIHKGVGAITESDVLLATASDAIIVGFNVRPVGNARMIADKEEIDIRTYSIIYAAINDLKDAMEGMLSPEVKEEITGTAEIREIFKVSKVGNIAGCMVMNGKIFRNSGIRIIRDGVVVHMGTLEALKRFKDDVREVAKGYDCGMQIKGYNDIQEGDVIEAFQEVEVKKKLK